MTIREFLLNHPALLLGMQVALCVSTPMFTILGTFVMPAILNRRFDPLLGPQKPGEKWEFGKSRAYPAYFYYRANDYALAIISDRFSRKKFSVANSFLRERVPRIVLPLCWVFKISQYTVFGLLLSVVLGAVVLKLVS